MLILYSLENNIIRTFHCLHLKFNVSLEKVLQKLFRVPNQEINLWSLCEPAHKCWNDNWVQLSFNDDFCCQNVDPSAIEKVPNEQILPNTCVFVFSSRQVRCIESQVTFLVSNSLRRVGHLIAYGQFGSTFRWGIFACSQFSQSRTLHLGNDSGRNISLQEFSGQKFHSFCKIWKIFWINLNGCSPGQKG